MRAGPPKVPAEGGAWPRGYRKSIWNLAWEAYREAREGAPS